MSSLTRLKDAWEALAERDALHSILTDAGRADGKWDVSEFMATGDSEIETVMCHLARLRCSPESNGTALDFGCGVGRLTQALARYFVSCVGVDISENMIEKATSLNQYAHCCYISISGTHLPFPDATFSFIYSNIVLQHVPRRFSKQYLREFLRVLAPAGVLVIGVQDSFAVSDVLSLLTRIRHILHLRSRIKVALGLGTGDMKMHCLPERVIRRALGSAKIIDIQITNISAKDFNGKLLYLRQAPKSGYIGKQYCVVKVWA